MFGLEEKHFNFILEVLNKNIPNAKYFVFGSRAKKTNSKYSDIDIAINYNNQKIKVDVLAKIISVFENSTLPIKVDIIDINSIDDNFKNIIKNTLIEIKNPL